MASHYTLKIFIEAFKNKLQKKKQIKRKLPKSNLANEKIEVSKDLSLRDDTNITKADKHCAVVITDVDNYINQANLHLNNEECFKEFPNDLTKINRKNLTNQKKVKTFKAIRKEDSNKTRSLRIKNTGVLHDTKHTLARKSYKVVYCHKTSISQ